MTLRATRVPPCRAAPAAVTCARQRDEDRRRERDRPQVRERPERADDRHGGDGEEREPACRAPAHRVDLERRIVELLSRPITALPLPPPAVTLASRRGIERARAQTPSFAHRHGGDGLYTIATGATPITAW